MIGTMNYSGGIRQSACNMNKNCKMPKRNITLMRKHMNVPGVSASCILNLHLLSCSTKWN